LVVVGDFGSQSAVAPWSNNDDAGSNSAANIFWIWQQLPHFFQLAIRPIQKSHNLPKCPIHQQL
jgi:hypothetical protein